MAWEHEFPWSCRHVHMRVLDDGVSVWVLVSYGGWLGGGSNWVVAHLASCTAKKATKSTNPYISLSIYTPLANAQALSC